MVGSARLVGQEKILAEIERRLGDAKIKRVVNSILKEEAQEVTEELRGVISGFQMTGKNTAAVDHGGISSASGVPSIKIGFGDASRAPLVHLSEFGYAGKSNPRGFGAIRKLVEAKKITFAKSVQAKVIKEIF